MLRRTTFLTCAILFIAACAGRGGPSLDADKQALWQQQQDRAGAVNEWDMYARGVLRRTGEAYNVNLRWQREAGGEFTMTLEAPFGQGVLRIENSAPDQYRLRLPDGQTFINDSPEALLVDVIGWSLPISGLDYWVRGLPDPRREYRHRLDAEGRARAISQDGWDIDYLDYFSDPEQPPLPRRMSLGNDELALKLVIERWRAVKDEAPDSDLFPSFN